MGSSVTEEHGALRRSALQFQIQVSDSDSDSDSDLNMKRGTKCGIAQSLFTE